MITKVSRNDYYAIMKCMTKDEILEKYGRLVIAEKK